MSDVSLSQPAYLFLLAAPAVLGMWYLFSKRRVTARWSNQQAVRTVLQHGKGAWRHVLAVVLFIVMAVAALVAARPAYAASTEEPRSAVMIVLDVSTSMTATDVLPTRLGAAQAAMSEMVKEAPADLNIGLVTVGGNASLVLSPSVQRAPLLDAIAALQPEPGGTATGEGVITAVQALDSVAGFGSGEPLPARILLISDGKEEIKQGLRDTTAGAEAAQAAGYPVYTVNYGTAEGTINGQPIRSDPDALARIASVSGGQSFEAGTQAELASALRSIPGAIAEKSAMVYFPVWSQLAAIVLVALLALGFVALIRA